MHSIFELRTTLSRTDTSLCFGSGVTIFRENCLVIDKHINCIESGCFDEWYIGPGGSLIFKGFIDLKPNSIISPLITDIVFEQDARISDDAFFSKTVNADLYKNYTFYSYKGSEVEKYANVHGFTFHLLEDFSRPKEITFDCGVCRYASSITFTMNNYYLNINEDRFIFYKKAEKRNGDYLFVESPFVRDSFKKEVVEFINEFLAISTNKEKEKYVCDLGEQLFLAISLNKKNSKKYLGALQKAFKDKEIENYINYFFNKTNYRGIKYEK